ncbi:MarR family winged helix-turn-helix transcriptional regulator [Leekyejoonella antrihumi]|nr:MarR family transcriptional regulator [Leekyejoonella antrihumi]
MTSAKTRGKGTDSPTTIPSSAPSGTTRHELVDALSWESRRAAALLGMLNRAVASKAKLNATDVETLGVLAVLGVATPTRLASLLAMGTGSMTLVLDRLERGGFVRRVRDAKDRRSVTIEVIEQRRAEVGAFFAPLEGQASETTERYSEKELAVIVDYLTRSNDMLNELTTTLTQGPTTADTGR